MSLVKIKRPSPEFVKRTPVGDNKDGLDAFLKKKIDAKETAHGIPLVISNPITSGTVPSVREMSIRPDNILGFVVDIDSENVVVKLRDDLDDTYEYDEYCACSCIITSKGYNKRKKFDDADTLFCFFPGQNMLNIPQKRR